MDAAGRHAAARNEFWRVQHHGLAAWCALARGILFNAAQSLFALSFLIRLRFALWAGLALVALFVAQVTIAFVFRNDEARVIASLTMLAWAYLALSIPFFITGLPNVIKVVRTHFDASKPVTPAIAEPKKL